MTSPLHIWSLYIWCLHIKSCELWFIASLSGISNICIIVSAAVIVPQLTVYPTQFKKKKRKKKGHSNCGQLNCISVDIGN